MKLGVAREGLFVLHVPESAFQQQAFLLGFQWRNWHHSIYKKSTAYQISS